MLEKTYSPSFVEKKWMAAWEKARLFFSRPSRDGKRSFTIVIPPPNVTGALHIGHALNNTLQDVMIRYHRLQGRESCWVPGTDHGGIATQNVMEKQLRAENQTRQALGREKFLERMQVWVRDCKKTILGQLTHLGCSLDFGREAFTMDEARAKAVYHSFREFYKKGLIYRGERMVNWCVRCGTALSDIEVEYEDRKGHLWHLRYPFSDDPGRFVTVATTRPETMLGDTAVAVHPDDARYKDLVGKKLSLPLTGHSLTVVADEHVDREFGTGAVKVTPGHDPNDFDIWQRHLEEMDGPRLVIGLDGKMTEAAGEKYAALSREEARERVVADLEALLGADGKPLLEKAEHYRHAVGVCYRCQQAIEPLVSEQWFMKMGALAKKALAAVDKGDFTIYPGSWTKPYRQWLLGIRDWCLSRQIWWGHRVPIWYCAECLGDRLFVPAADGEGGPDRPVRDLLADGVSLETIAAEGRYQFRSGDGKTEGPIAFSPGKPCACCGKSRFLQDTDVLDTWFSSALWPLSVFGWPQETEDLKFYYPTSVLVTGYEILYLWVARMQMMGLYFRDAVPFDHAVIHGIVRDKHGKKMSKSLGNVIDPLISMDKFGTDAFRFALTSQAYPGRDIPFSEDSIVGPRNFANKIWNSTRFVLMNVPETAPEGGYRLGALDRASLDLPDRWILAEFEACVARVRGHMEVYNTAAAADEVYGFLWDKFCDWYVELAKLGLSDEKRAPAVRTILVQVLSGTLKLLHPFMPYITEELFAALRPYSGETAEFVLGAAAPDPSGWADEEATGRMGFLMEAVRAIRALRSQLHVPPGLRIKAFYAGEKTEAGTLAQDAATVTHLARLETLEAASGGRPPQSATAVARKLTFYVPLAGILDIAKERVRLAKEADRVDKDLRRCEAQLANRSFVERAPESEVAKVRQRRQEAEAKHASLQDTLRALDGG
ncbi:MAG: valine--tRNA ligase [Elusimicrobiota bacterium]